MNLRSNFKDLLSDIRSMEGQYLNRIKTGSKLPQDHLELSYFSGLRNGLSFVFSALENQDLTTEQFEAMKKQILHLEEVVN